MKKIFITGISLITLIACNKNEEGSNLHLTGNIEGLSQGKIYIQKIQDTAFVILDSIEIKGDSKFESHITLEEPEMLYLTLDRGQSNSIDNSLPFFAEKGKMNINSKLKEFYNAAKITGSKNQELLEEFNSFNSKFNDENLILTEKRIKNQISKNISTADSINTAFDRLKIRKYRYTANFASTHGEHEIAPYLAVSEIADINIAYLDTIQKHLSPSVTKSKYGKMLDEHIKARKASE
ncbi:DUF4369 domain-containing protein [Flavobacterium sp. N2270]|uniref:DUF4369 domain-containing protein n=1 Tax=Flavobacterium sp. N2270 TaxID=2986831 RepID=UPI0022243631|nr:DUF4369 domain-containing protein [Flavobacterium sp. N2270]